MTPSNIQLTDYFLDNYIAHKLSALTQCGAPELEDDSKWLNAFILNSIVRSKIETKTKAYIFNFLRRAEGASGAYRDARHALLEHLASARNVVSPYFKALTHFEICIAQCYQGYELLASAAGEKLYEPGSGTVEERLQTVHVDSKHMDKMIHGDKLPAISTSGIWITNIGIESSRGAIAFTEMHKLLVDMQTLAEKLCLK